MGGQYKKKLRAEKAKVKLKGAKLPKGLNVTKTEFKVRKIQIREQLKESYTQGQRQINLKETLNKLKHHGPTFRLEALRNLREAILMGHEAIGLHLQEVVQSVSSIGLDIERDPRRESFNVLSKLLAFMSAEAVAPFFHIISTYLRCAMTHIQPTIQEDSLLMLDVLLNHVPELVAEQSGKIFEDFLQMISRVRAEGEANRTLTVNMGERQTTIKWRAKVLQRLQLMLKTQCQLQQKKCGTHKKANTYQMHTFNPKAPQYFSLKRKYSVPDISDMFILPTINLANETKATDDANTIRLYIKHLMPLLFEAWLEVRPQESTNPNKSTLMGAQLLLSQDAAVTLNVILDIMGNIWTLIDLGEKSENGQSVSKSFQKDYADTFATNFLHLSAFPYQQSDRESASASSKKGRKAADLVGGQFCELQNISLTYLMFRFSENRIGKKSTKYFIILVEYLERIVRELKQNSYKDHQHILVSTLRTALLLNGRALFPLLAEKLRQLLRATIDAFLHQNFSNKEQNSALVLLCDVIQDNSLFNMYGQSEFDEFLRFLPQLLLKSSITENTLISMSNLCKKQNKTFMDTLAIYINEVIENIVKIQVQGAVNVFEGKKHIMNLFYWIEKPINTDELCEKIATNISDKRIVSYFMFVLKRQ